MFFAEYNSAGVLEGFANNIPSYVLQQFTYCDVDITDENGTYSVLLPKTFHGGIGSEAINDSEHYYYSNNGNEVIMESTNYYIDD